MRDGILYAELSYKVIGVCFDVFGKLGYGHKEEQYQRALGIGFGLAGISYQEQIGGRLEYQGKCVGGYRVDFVIENVIVLEIKAIERFRHDNYQQLKTYLSQTGLKLGLLVRFSSDGVVYKRILRPFVDSKICSQ
jgi:GxxExxY protein